MGRYITGDVQRKIWFGVQSSDAASRFGVEPSEPAVLCYYFTKDDDLKSVQEELKNIENTIGIENIKKLDDFFDKVNGYNDDILKEHNVFDIYKKNVSDYADYKLGIDIERCLLETNYCSFDAEI